MLHFPLKINGAEIGQFTAVRKNGGTHPDDINTYDVSLWNTQKSESNLLWEGNVNHVYGRGAWALVHKALETYFEEGAKN